MTFINSTISQICLLTAVVMIASVLGGNSNNKMQADRSNPTAPLCGRHLAQTIIQSLQTEGSSEGDDSNELDKIQGGYPAAPGEIPWLVNIALVAHGLTIPLCAGVIISQHWILTSYACAKPRRGHIYSLKVGDIFLYHQDLYERTYAYKRIVLYKGFNKSHLYDIALIKVKGRGIDFNNYIQPICMPAAGETPAVGAALTLAGWGHHVDINIPRYQKSLTAAVISKDNCSTLGGLNSPRVMCIGVDDHTIRVCSIDRGGPVYYKSGDIYILAGILSAPLGHCSDLRQGAAFANISRYTKWITKNIKRYSRDTERDLPSRPA